MNKIKQKQVNKIKAKTIICLESVSMNYSVLFVIQIPRYEPTWNEVCLFSLEGINIEYKCLSSANGAMSVHFGGCVPKL